jgi:hypothetical protein
VVVLVVGGSVLTVSNVTGAGGVVLGVFGTVRMVIGGSGRLVVVLTVVVSVAGTLNVTGWTSKRLSTTRTVAAEVLKGDRVVVVR